MKKSKSKTSKKINFSSMYEMIPEAKSGASLSYVPRPSRRPKAQMGYEIAPSFSGMDFQPSMPQKPLPMTYKPQVANGPLGQKPAMGQQMGMEDVNTGGMGNFMPTQEDILAPLSLISSIIPDRQVRRQYVRPEDLPTNQQNMYGTGSQALYRHGGQVHDESGYIPYIPAWDEDTYVGMQAQNGAILPFMEDIYPDEVPQAKSGWIQKAINPKHKGYCTPMTKKTCTPRRKALAKRFKSGDLSRENGGPIEMYQEGGEITPMGANAVTAGKTVSKDYDNETILSRRYFPTEVDRVARYADLVNFNVAGGHDFFGGSGAYEQLASQYGRKFASDFGTKVKIFQGSPHYKRMSPEEKLEEFYRTSSPNPEVAKFLQEARRLGGSPGAYYQGSWANPTRPKDTAGFAQPLRQVATMENGGIISDPSYPFYPTKYKAAKYRKGGKVNNTGYLDGYETANNPYNIIPGGDITMRGVSRPIVGVPIRKGNFGQAISMMPGQDYQFNADAVLEYPDTTEPYFEEGMEYDLSPFTIKRLLAQGYTLE